MTTYIIVLEGMGNAFNPPGHAEHNYSLKEIERGREVGFSSLSYAAGPETTWVPQDVKERCRKLLADNPGNFTDAWERECYAYWRNCYSPDGIDRNVSNLVISRDGSLPPERHAAFLHVKSFFPEANPRLDLIQNPPAYGKSENKA